ncbi:hypothetical protein [Methanofollis liminatans]|uniref:hypothetical protein n=1 Tax=Methanofollis liminatans TaxID=2201 RepID=UPI0012F6B53B|nr:hypothetical protein [Methanofollis liminatans]
MGREPSSGCRSGQDRTGKYAGEKEAMKVGAMNPTDTFQISLRISGRLFLQDRQQSRDRS